MMELVERAGYLNELNERFGRVVKGTGHTVFLMGEAGVGKTALVNHFVNALGNRALCVIGACDSLFTPRPLGPLHDISNQLTTEVREVLRNEKDRAQIFSTFLQTIKDSHKPVVMVFEDVHWADEATIDFIKFLSRRITRSNCLFILTLRDNEALAPHPLSTIFGQLEPDSFSKIHLRVLSKDAVNKMAVERGYDSGDKIYGLTGGNPFYVQEILANDGLTVPERVKDSIITTFHSKDEKMRELWEVLSILPSRIDFNLLEELEPDYPHGLEDAIRSGVIVNRNDYLMFKHELFRIAIEESLTRYRRKALHARVLKIMLKSPSSTLAQLVHHARKAEDKDLVLDLAPRAGKEASLIGAHVEAARLYQAAIDFASPDEGRLPDLYSSFAYECYLTNQFDTGITAQEKALAIWRRQQNNDKVGDALRFLSRLYWFSGERNKATKYGEEAVSVLGNGMPTRELALAYSNLSQLNMLHDNREKTLHWGQKAIALAEDLNDAEILSHALNNVGGILMKMSSRSKEGIDMLKESLSIALSKGLEEHAARAYTNLAAFSVLIRDYNSAREYFDAGMKYCEDLDLLSWYYYMLGEKTHLLVETGQWQEAEQVSLSLRDNPEITRLTKIGATISLAILKIRRGVFDVARQLIDESKLLAATTDEPYRVVPIIQAELELCWTARQPIPFTDADEVINLLPDATESWLFTNVAFWMRKCQIDIPADDQVKYAGPFKLQSKGESVAAALEWKNIGCLFESALTLAEGDEESQRQALAILDQLGATATSEMLKGQMRDRGMRHIPRGPRESTRNNPAQLTTRQIEILSLLKEGAQNKQIAERLFISPKTVDHHISALLSKLEVSSRNQAVAEATKLGILK